MLSDNCEHLVTWARTGKGESKQVKKGTGAGLVGLGAGAVAGAVIGSAFAPGVETIVGASLVVHWGCSEECSVTLVVRGNPNHLDLSTCTLTVT